MQDAGIDLRQSSHVVREATSSRLRPPTRLADGGDRAQDHVRDGLWLRDHDHVGALDLGDRRPGAPGHGTDDIATGRLVAGRNHGPGRQGLPGGHPGRLGERPLGNGPLGGGHQGGLLGGQVGGEGLMEVCRIDRKLHGGLCSLSRRILERDQGGVQDAVLRGAFDIAQALPFVGGEGGDIDQADDVAGCGGGVGDHAHRRTSGRRPGPGRESGRTRWRCRQSHWRCHAGDWRGQSPAPRFLQPLNHARPA